MLSLMERLVEEKNLSRFAADDLKIFSEKCSDKINYDIFKYGVTFMPVEIAMRMHEENNREIEVLVEVSNDADDSEEEDCTSNNDNDSEEEEDTSNDDYDCRSDEQLEADSNNGRDENGYDDDNVSSSSGNDNNNDGVTSDDGNSSDT